MMFFFLLMLSRYFSNASLNIFGGNFQIGGEQSYTFHQVTVTKSNLYEALQRCMTAKQYRSAVDSMPAQLKTEEALRMQDSIQKLINFPWENATSMLLNSMSESETPHNPLDSLQIHVGVTKVTLSTQDFATLEPDSLIRKYQLDEWLEKVTVRQGIKAIRDQRGFINRYVGSMGWTILSAIALMALVLWLFYRKRNPYYVEHFIFLIHQQAGTYLMLTIAMAINSYLFPLDGIWLFVLGWYFLNLIPGIHRFYGDSWGWAIFKGLFFISLQFIMLILLFLATLLFVFAIF
ncbi:MAG: hypothetical protein JNJ57_21465 [Saprospiraceae bacterium]|nr:hypothetical protein [Saprospiraceae bacterium]